MNYDQYLGRTLTWQLAALVVDDYTINHYKSLEIIKGRLKNHIISAFGHRKAVTITTGDLTRYVIERQAEGITVCGRGATPTSTAN